jgi:hypothetical protein
VPSTRHLGELHLTIQAAFNWRNCHLHEFHFGELRYGDPEVADDGDFDDDPGFFDESEVRLCDFGREHPAPFTYLYDFGDDWRHIVEIEALVTADVTPRPVNCVAGARARPPEDVGGVGDYENILANGYPLQ